ncbi:MAG: hypothetical protein WEC14_09765 [Chloroflexota bacterium]
MSERLIGRPIPALANLRLSVLVAAVFLTVATSVVAQEPTGYAARPAPGDGDRSSARFALSVETGSSVSDAVEIFNLTDEPVSFDVYAAEAVLATGGGLAPASRDAEIGGAAAWITVDQSTVVVAPRSSLIVRFTIHAPIGTDPGDQRAALLIEPERPTGTGDIAASTRVGLWVDIKVVGEIPWRFPWILVIVVLSLAVIAGLLYVTRDRRRRWLADRREEEAMLRDLRNRRRHADGHR